MHLFQSAILRTVELVPNACRYQIVVRENNQLRIRAQAGYDSTPQFSDTEQSWFGLPEIVTIVNRVSVPIIVSEKVYARLNVEFDCADAITPAILSLLTLLCEHTAVQIDQQRSAATIATITQEVYLLTHVLNTISSTNNISYVLGSMADLIAEILPHDQWQSMTLALLSPDKHHLVTFENSVTPAMSYWQNVKKGVIAAGQRHNININYVGGAVNSTGQAEAMYEAIRLGVHGIGIAPIDAIVLEPAIRHARAAGIPVVAFDSPPLDNSEALMYVGTDNIEAGYLAGSVMRRLLPNQGSIGISITTKEALNSRERLEGFQSAIDGTDLYMLTPLEDYIDAQRGIRLAREALQENPEMIGAFGVCGGNGPAWAQVVQEMSLDRPFTVLSFDLTPDSIAGLKAGTIQAVIAQREYEIGYRTVEALYSMVVDGVEQTLSQLPASRMLTTQVDVVTLKPTSWSRSLAEHLMTMNQTPLETLVSQKEEDPGTPIQLTIIGMADRDDLEHRTQCVPITQDLIEAQVIAKKRPVLDDRTTESVSHTKHEQQPIHTVICVPMQSGNTMIGTLRLESVQKLSHESIHVAQIQRIADSIAIALANAQLVSQVTERTRELEQANQAQQHLLRTVMDLSSPIVPIARGILVMPLIGSFDTQRASRFMETLLGAISSYKARVVLVDITGIAIVDTAVANYLIQAARAANLLGAETVLVGIMPAVAQTLVSLGLNLSQLATYASLESGFAYALTRIGGQILYHDRINGNGSQRALSLRR